jgi:hypothetical protein
MFLTDTQGEAALQRKGHRKKDRGVIVVILRNIAEI